MTAPELPAVERALRASWARDTSDDPDNWSTDNPALGQCAVSALVVRALYGGDIVIATVLDRDGERTPDGHAWNVLPDGRHIDFAFDQFRDGEGLGPEIVTEPVIDGDPRRAHLLAERVADAAGRADRAVTRPRRRRRDALTAAPSQCDPDATGLRPPAPTLAPMSNQQIVESTITAWNARDEQAFVAAFDADCEITIPGLVLRGTDGAAAFWHGYQDSFPDNVIRARLVFADGDAVAEEAVFEGTHTGPLPTPDGGEIAPTGNTVATPFVLLYTLADGRITSMRLYFDQVEMLTRLGLMPAMAT